jgi:signal peptidase I
MVLVLGYVLSSVSIWNIANSTVRISRWWLLLIVPVSLLFISADGNLGLLISGFKPFSIPSSSMAPTIRLGDRINVDLRFYKTHSPAQGNVIVFRHHDQFLVKRLIALPGDEVKVEHDIIFVNGSRLAETYVLHVRGGGEPDIRDVGPLKVASNQVFVVGDNRDVSFDSRHPLFGAVMLSDIVGKPLYLVRSNDDRYPGTQIR